MRRRGAAALLLLLLALAGCAGREGRVSGPYLGGAVGVSREDARLR